MTSIRVAAGVIPAAVIVAAAGVMLAYPLTEKTLRRMVAEIAERRSRDAVIQPDVGLLKQESSPHPPART